MGGDAARGGSRPLSWLSGFADTVHVTKFPPRRRIEHPVDVEGPDGVVYRGVYWTETGALFVRAADQQANPRESEAVRIGWTDELCLAKTVLLRLYGHPTLTWGGWRPAGCEDLPI